MNKNILVAAGLGFVVALLFMNFTLYKPNNSLTFYPNFINANECFERFVGFDKTTSSYIKTPVPSACWNQPFRFTVTHENRNNTKIGDLNHNHLQEMIGFMSDYTEDHFGSLATPRLFLSEFKTASDGTMVLHMGSNTLAGQINSVTGRAYGDGFLFMGVTDGAIWPRAELALDQDFQIQFSYRIVKDVIGQYPDSAQLNSHRVTLGFNIDWKENTPRTNRNHFLEFDLYMSQGYFDIRKQQMSHPSQCPKNDGIHYDYCYTDNNPDGKYVDGKYLSLSQFADQPATYPTLNAWRKVSIPLSAFIRAYGWQNLPAEGWSKAVLAGMYFGIESQGAQQLQIEIKNYQFKRGLPKIPFAKVPENLFRVSNSLFVKQEASYCAIVSLGHLQSYGYDTHSAQNAFNSAPLLMAQSINAPYEDACKLPAKNAIYRSSTTGLFSNGDYVCHFESPEHYRRWGFTDNQYASAADLGSMSIVKNFNYVGRCSN